MVEWYAHVIKCIYDSNSAPWHTHTHSQRRHTTDTLGPTHTPAASQPAPQHNTTHQPPRSIHALSYHRAKNHGHPPSLSPPSLFVSACLR